MKLHRFSFLFGLGCLASFCFSSAKVEGIAASVKSTGMAATAIAYPLDTLAAAYNPAGIYYVGDRIDAGAYWSHNTGHLEISNNIFPLPGINGSFDGMRTKDFYAGDFGINKTFCCGCCNFSVGLIGYNRNFQKTTFKNVQPLFGTSKPGLEYVHYTIAPVIAFEICECHAIGVAFNWQIQRIKVDGLRNFANPLISSSPSHVTNNGYNYSQGITFTIGWRSQLTECIAIGLTYQPKTKMDRFDKYRGLLAEHGKFDIPEKYGAGICFTPWDCWTFCFDFEYVRWDKIKALNNNLQPGISLPGSLGTSRGAGFGWKSQAFYRFGLEYAFDDCITLRAGYRYAKTPIRSSQTAVNVLTLDLVEQFVTVGGTWQFCDCSEISAFYAYGFEKKLSGSNVIPLIPFGGGDVEIKEKKSVVGVSIGWWY
jgi:long-chain fatty acid transport protein